VSLYTGFTKTFLVGVFQKVKIMKVDPKMNLIINGEKLLVVVHLETSYARSAEFLVFVSAQLNLSDIKPAEILRGC